MEKIIKLYLRAKHGEMYDELFLELAKTPGTGASGGLVAAILACFDKSKIVSGMDFVTTICKLEKEI